MSHEWSHPTADSTQCLHSLRKQELAPVWALRHHPHPLEGQGPGELLGQVLTVPKGFKFGLEVISKQSHIISHKKTLND